MRKKERLRQIPLMREGEKEMYNQRERKKERYTHSERDTVGGEREKNIQIEREKGMYRQIELRGRKIDRLRRK